jgi:hypothetical protein
MMDHPLSPSSSADEEKAFRTLFWQDQHRVEQIRYACAVCTGPTHISSLDVWCHCDSVCHAGCMELHRMHNAMCDEKHAFECPDCKYQYRLATDTMVAVDNVDVLYYMFCPGWPFVKRQLCWLIIALAFTYLLLFVMYCQVHQYEGIGNFDWECHENNTRMTETVFFVAFCLDMFYMFVRYNHDLCNMVAYRTTPLAYFRHQYRQVFAELLVTWNRIEPLAKQFN